MQKNKAFEFAVTEEFGIIPVESQAACGTPVIAYGKGGAKETVEGCGQSKEPTGLFFDEQEKARLFKSQKNLKEYKTKFARICVGKKWNSFL